MSFPVAWSMAPKRARPAPAEVDVWLVPLEQPATVTAALGHYLAPIEHARAHRFHFQRHRRRYIVARGALRSVLGQALNSDPALLVIDYTKFGKPFLPDFDLHFNVSHSHELALIAVAGDRHVHVGIDVEYAMRQVENLADMAARFFSRTENDVFQALPAELQQEAFFNCWTRKEAYIKALGEGLSHPLDCFDVTLRPDEPARFLRIGDDPAEPGRWTLTAFAPEADYVAALAVAGRVELCHLYRFVAAEADQAHTFAA